jgi:hypothetical protein
MTDEMFEELCEGLRQAIEIARGEREPANVTEIEEDDSAQAAVAS